jgi:hypothetical protein
METFIVAIARQMNNNVTGFAACAFMTSKMNLNGEQEVK